MAENNLTEVADGDIVGIDDINQSVRAFKGNVVPRNTEGVATTRAGSLGTESLQWDDLHVQRIVLAGDELQPGAGGAGGAVAQLFQNGVVSGVAPTDRAGMCGWMLQAGTAGVRIVASAENPLVVRVGGEEYTLTSSIVGGAPLPSVVAMPTRVNWSLESGGDENITGSTPVGAATLGMQGHYALINGNPFLYGAAGEPEVPSTIGDLIIFSYRDVSGGPRELFMFERSDDISGRIAGKRAIRAAFNDSSSAYRFVRHDFDLTSASSTREFQLLTPGYVFIDPTTDPWSVLIQPRILGTTAEALPATASAGQVIYRQTTQKWYNFEGAAWVEKEWVFLGIAAIEDVGGSPSVAAVAGVRSENALRQLYQTAELIHAPGGTWDRNRQAIYDHRVNGTLITLNPPDTTAAEPLIEERSPQAYMNQRHELLRSRFQIDADQKSTIRAENGLSGDVNSDTYCIWVDAFTRETFADDCPPVIVSLSVGRAFLAHQHKNAVLIGSFSQNAVGDTPVVPTGDIALTQDATIGPAIWQESVSITTPEEAAITEDNSVQVRGGYSFEQSTILGNVGNRGSMTVVEKSYSNSISVFAAFSSNRSSGVTIRIGAPTLGDISDKVDP